MIIAQAARRAVCTRQSDGVGTLQSGDVEHVGSGGRG